MHNEALSDFRIIRLTAANWNILTATVWEGEFLSLDEELFPVTPITMCGNIAHLYNVRYI